MCQCQRRGSITLTADPPTATAGTAIETITLTADGGTFADEQSENNFSISGAGITSATVTNATKQADENKVQLTVSGCTPTQQGNLIVKAEAAAFTEPGEEATATITVKPAPTPEVSASPDPLQAGTGNCKIVLTISGDNSFKSDATGDYTISGTETLTVTGVELGAENKTATLTVSTPTKKGSVAVTIKKEAFTYQPESNVTTNSVTIDGADVSVTASGTLIAGTAGGTIDLEITSGDNTFASREAGNYTLECDNGNDLTVESVTLGAGSGGNNTKATLKVKEAPTKKGSVTVKIDSTAFTYQPESAEITATGTVTINAATVKVNVEESTLIAGVSEGSIKIKLTTVNNFADGVSADMFSFDPESGAATGLNITDVSGKGTDTAELTVTGTPQKPGEKITVTIKPEAFEFQPGEDVTATVTVSAPSGSIKAELVGDPLYAGTAVNGQKITVSIQEEGNKGLKFKETLEPSAFAFEGTGTNGLSISKVEVKDGVATLTLGGTPTTAGTFNVKAKTSAFDPAPGAEIQATGDITVKDAPEVSLTADPKETTTGVALGTVTLTASSTVDSVKFADSVDASKFQLSGGASDGLSVSVDSATGKTAKLTITGAPTTAGDLTITVGADAFYPVAAADVTVTIKVDAVSGTVSASTSDTLTAGTDATNNTITLTIDSGNLTFKNDAFTPSTDFALTGDGADGLKIEKAEKSGDGVTLTLTGTPKQAGALGVTVQTSAFAVPPTSGDPVTADSSIEVDYPTITLSAKADSPIFEDEDISKHTITLTADGGIFNATADTTNFSVSGIEGVSGVASVKAEGGTNTATLTLSGTPTKDGTLTITVKPAAFQYQPQNAVEATVTVAKPSGTVTAALVGAPLYAGTPVTNQTITVSIDTGSHGLEFKATGELTTDAFTLGLGETAEATGLTIDKVDVKGTTATLTLSGTPSKAGDITVTAETSAFKFLPASDIKASGTITVNPAPTVILTPEPANIVAGIDTTIKLTIQGETTFVAEPGASLFELSGDPETVASGLTVSNVSVDSTTSKTVTLTLSAAPTAAGTLTVTVDPKAFVIRPESAPTAEIIVSALYGEISAKLNNGTLTAGTEVDGQTITLSITKTNGLTFKDGVAATDFQLGPGSEDLTITDVTRDNDTSVTLKLSGIPAAKGEFTVTALAAAFTVAPTEKDSLISTNKISIDYPTITLSVNPDTIYEGEAVDNIPITVTADGGVFDPDNIGVEKGNITISGHEELTLKSVEKGESDDTVVLHLSGTPSTIGTLIITIKPEAFTYQPEKALTATVTVSRPTGTVTAELTGEPLYAGTPVNGQTVILTIGASSHGLTFQPLDKLNINEFMLKQDAAAGLTIDGISRDSDTQVTLTLGGTPTTAGTFEVDAEHTAFTYDPGMEEPAGTFTVNPAPVITVTADPASVTAGLELGAVTITAEGGTFAAQPEPEMFTITSEDGIADNISVTAVKVEDDGTVTLTVTGAPTKDGTLLVTVDRTAFNIRPESSPQAKIAVTKLTGSVSMALAGGTLTAGTAADGLTLELAASGAGLTFREGAEPDDFALTGPGAEGLTVASVTRTDETHVTLTLSGTPAMAGELGVTVLVSAFAVPPTDGEDVTAAPSVTVAYPTITLAPTPATANEGEALTTITLTATGGVFNAIDGGTDGFAISGVEGVTLVSVTAADGSDTATLTLSGVPSATGTLTVTVQPEAFKYQPEKAVSAAISVVDPTGTVNAALSNALYADTPVTDQTITITIADSHGLTFKDGLGPDSFLLTGAAAAGLSISGVTGSGSAVTLTLSGTPAAGSFTVTVLAEAFTFDPGMDIDAGTVTVNAAPEVSLSAEPETLTAGEPVGTVTLTAVGGAFAAQPDTSLFALSGDAASGLSVSAVSVEGAVAVLTVTGAPEIAGTLTVTVDRTAFAPVAAASPTVDITVEAYGDGSLSTEVEVDPSAPGTQFGSSDAELADAVLTEEEQALLDAGAKVVITLQEDDISDSVSSTDKAAVEANADGFTVGAYLDVSLLKSINDHETPIHETNRPIRVVFSIPTDLRGVSGREFAVVRVHEGSGTVLQDLDGDPNTITVETDLFSTYAILYRDAPTEEPTEEPTDEPTEEPVEEPTEEPTDEPTEEPTPVSTEEPKPTEKPSATAAPTAPDTGDDEAPALWLALLTLGAGALVLVGGLLRRRSAQR